MTDKLADAFDIEVQKKEHFGYRVINKNGDAELGNWLLGEFAWKYHADIFAASLTAHEAAKAATPDDVREAVDFLKQTLPYGLGGSISKAIDTVSETALRQGVTLPMEVVEKLSHGWYLIPPEPTDEMIRAYMFERAKGQYPHEDAGGSVARKLKALFTGKRQSQEERTYQQAIDALLDQHARGG